MLCVKLTQQGSSWSLKYYTATLIAHLHKVYTEQPPSLQAGPQILENPDAVPVGAYCRRIHILSLIDTQCQQIT